jgi:hypothetical protein
VTGLGGLALFIAAPALRETFGGGAYRTPARGAQRTARGVRRAAYIITCGVQRSTEVGRLWRTACSMRRAVCNVLWRWWQ